MYVWMCIYIYVRLHLYVFTYMIIYVHICISLMIWRDLAIMLVVSNFRKTSLINLPCAYLRVLPCHPISFGVDQQTIRWFSVWAQGTKWFRHQQSSKNKWQWPKWSIDLRIKRCSILENHQRMHQMTILYLNEPTYISCIYIYIEVQTASNPGRCLWPFVIHLYYESDDQTSLLNACAMVKSLRCTHPYQSINNYLCTHCRELLMTNVVGWPQPICHVWPYHINLNSFQYPLGWWLVCGL